MIGIRGNWGAPWGCRGCRGVRGALGWQVDWELNLGPSPGSQHSHWFPLGSDLPHAGKGPFPGSHHSHWFSLGSNLPGQGQASARNAFCRLLYTFGTIFLSSLHICIYATSSHILTHNVKKCYMDYFLCRPIYAYPYTINLMYYDTMVLIMKNYFSHQISEFGYILLSNVKLTWCSTAFCISHV